MRYITLGILLSIVLVLPACGGGGAGERIAEGVGQALRQIFPPMDPNVTGFVSNRGSATTEGRQYVGDTSNNYAFRATTGFEISEPPADGPGLERATLRIDIGEVRGDVARLGALWVEAVDLGTHLEAGDYGRTAWARIRVPDTVFETGLLEIDVTDLMIELYATGRRKLDLRLRFSVPYSGDDGADGLLFDTTHLMVEWR